MRRDNKLYLEDILTAIEKIEAYTEGISLEIIWDVLQNKLPGLRAQVVKMLKE